MVPSLPMLRLLGGLCRCAPTPRSVAQCMTSRSEFPLIVRFQEVSLLVRRVGYNWVAVPYDYRDPGTFIRDLLDIFDVLADLPHLDSDEASVVHSE